MIAITGLTGHSGGFLLQQFIDQTENKCNTLKDEAYAEAEKTRNKSHADAEALSAKTEYECKVMREETSSYQEEKERIAAYKVTYRNYKRTYALHNATNLTHDS